MRMLSAVMAVSLLAGCSTEQTQGDSAAAVLTPHKTAPDAGAAPEAGKAFVGAPVPAAALTPLLGGLVHQLGQYIVELAAREDGRMEVQVRDPQGQPVPTETVTVAAEIPSGQTAVPVALAAEDDRYVGTVVNVDGPQSVVVSVQPEQGEELEHTFPQVEMSAVQATLEPMHSGQVTLVGDNRVEVSTQSNGEVYVSVTDYQGVPLPPTAVVLPNVTIVTPTGPRIVPLQPRGAIFVGTLGAPPPPRYGVRFDVQIGERRYRRVRLRRYHPMPPGAVVVVPPAFTQPRVWVTTWRPAPVVYVSPRVRGRAKGPRPVKGHGWHKGWGKAGRGKGVVHIHAPGPPRVKVHAPGPPRVDVHVHHHGNKGRHKGHKRGHGKRGRGKRR